AVRFVIAWPSGSLAVTLIVSVEPSTSVAVAGAVTTGARSGFMMLMLVVAEPDKAFDAVKVTEKLPVWELVGVQLNVPDVLAAFAVNVAPVGSGVAVSDAMASPSGSDAVTVNVTRTFGAPLTELG